MVVGPLKPGRLVEKARLASTEGGAGTDLAANVFVGVFLGWLAQKAWPEIDPYGMAGGVVLGSISGFYQLFKRERLRAEREKKKRKEKSS